MLDYHGGGIEAAQPGKLAGEPFALAGKTRNQIGKALALDGHAPLETTDGIVARFQRPGFQRNRQALKPEGRLLAGIADDPQGVTLGGFTHGAKWGAAYRVPAGETVPHAARAPRKSAAPVENGP